MRSDFLVQRELSVKMAKTPMRALSPFYLELHIVDDVRTYFQTTSKYHYIPNLTADKAEVAL